MKYPQGQPTYFGNLLSSNPGENHSALEFSHLRNLIIQDCASQVAYDVIGRLEDTAIAFSIFEKHALGCVAFYYHLLPPSNNLREIVMQGKDALAHLQARICVKLDPSTGELLGTYAVQMSISDH